MVSVGYMDPGNWATDLEGGARFNCELIWVLLLSNAIAILLQKTESLTIRLWQKNILINSVSALGT